MPLLTTNVRWKELGEQEKAHQSVAERPCAIAPTSIRRELGPERVAGHDTMAGTELLPVVCDILNPPTGLTPLAAGPVGPIEVLAAAPEIRADRHIKLLLRMYKHTRRTGRDVWGV